ncbi:hypothetical protein KC678_00640 [Candidatus Dojkabacteria bacterium]|uniref:Uncharacterized protein n=1 Tax=Candidatus Dojkabacteria bacterium TaxID=2099670 RepID=A0A955IAP2_9BACT|nr:hypothetical protein [Candidatus Dojkabacteria bacterium]
MTLQQLEKEVKKLELSNKALRKELDWFSSYINRFYPTATFLVVSFIYFSTSSNHSILEAIKFSSIYTLLFAILNIILARLFQWFWLRFIKKD